MKPLIILFTHHNGKQRHSNNIHRNAFKKYLSANIIEINTYFSVRWNDILKLKPDAIILHTSFLSIRWSGGMPRHFETMCKYFKDTDILKFAFPQDEFFNSKILDEIFICLKPDKIYTCAAEDDVDKIYPLSKAAGIVFERVLTGYLDVDLLEGGKKEYKNRKYDVVYRAWKPYKWLGKKANLKSKIGEVFRKIVDSKNLIHDISTESQATLTGKDWFNLLCDSKMTIGMEGGASVLDYDGSLAGGKPISDEELNNRDGEISLFCVSPRHFEAVAAGTVQILIRGEYNGIFKENIHYISVDEDLSNVEQAINKGLDEKIVHQILSNVKHDIIDSGKYTYKKFIEDFEAGINLNLENYSRKRPLILFIKMRIREIVLRQLNCGNKFLDAITKIRSMLYK